MKIKEKLKQLGIKISEFAEQLEISRPTLDNYIGLYEKSENIPNDKYQVIFDKLFGDGIETKEEFVNYLESYHDLIERDIALGTLDLDAETTDLMTSILEKMKADLSQNDYDESVYIFINYLIRSYRKVSLFRDYANYVLYLNNIKKLEDITPSEKVFISNIYKIMSLANEDKLEFDEKAYNEFLLRVNEIKQENDKEEDLLKEKLVKEILNEKLNAAIKEELKLGVSIEDIDINELMKKIDFSIE